MLVREKQLEKMKSHNSDAPKKSIVFSKMFQGEPYVQFPSRRVQVWREKGPLNLESFPEPNVSWIYHLYFNIFIKI